MKTDALKELVSGLDLQTDLWWLAMILSGFIATFLAAFGFPGAGTFFIYLAVLVRLAIVAGVSQQPFGTVFVQLLPLGLVAGVFALFGDHMLVNWVEPNRGQRVYPEHTGVLLSSPIYIPLYWTCAVIEFGYMIVRIWGLAAGFLPSEAALGVTMVTGGLVAAIWTACTDFWAVKAGWWSYRPGEVIMGGACALYVVMSAFLIFTAFPLLFVRYLSCTGGRLYASIRYGAIFGAIIFLSYITSHLLVEKRL
jgi:hypothetical protein